MRPRLDRPAPGRLAAGEWSGDDYKLVEDWDVDTTLYPDMKADWYWTRQETPWSSGSVFCVYFGLGDVNGLSRGDKAFVRPVRSVSPGQ